MYRKDDLIVYGSSGVCRVEEIGPMKGSKDKREYYTLSPLFGSGVIYTPVDTTVFMRPILTKDEVEGLIDRLPQLEPRECDLSNLRLLTEHYHAAFQGHQCEDLLLLIKELHRRGENNIKKGRRIGLTEMKFRKQAEELVHGEFSVALGIPFEEVPNYIAQRLGEQETISVQV